MKMKFARLFIVSSLCVIALSRIGKGAAADCVSCGDANGDGMYTVADIAYITAFLYAGGPAPAECADIDGYDLITIRDLVAGGMLLPPACVTQLKIVAEAKPNFEIRYSPELPPNVSIHTFNVSLKSFYTPQGYRIKAFDLPLLVKIDGEAPVTISASTTLSNWPGGGISVETDSTLGAVLAFDLDGSVASFEYLMFQITVGVSPSLTTRVITLEYTELGPTMSGVFAHPNSACHYAMFLDQNLNTWLPTLATVCRCGDADNNGAISISDCVFIINHIFAGAPAPSRYCQGDSDGNEILTISDAVFLIGYIFAGGPAPSGC